MTHSCRHYFEENGEWCKAKRQSCTCVGLLTQCDFPLYFNASDEVVKNQRILDSIERTKAEVEPFI